MSTWNLGIDDVSEETRAFRNKLSSKDGHIAAQQSQLLKQAADLDELKSTLHDTLHKLTRETARVLQLEADLNHCSDDLRNEKIASQNAGAALAAAQDKYKLKELEARDLQASLESLSHTSDEHNSRNVKLEREKATLDARVRELEANLRCPPTTSSRNAASRPRSSSLSSFRITTLEQDLNEVRASLSQRDTDLRVANQKLSQVQSELIKVDNEKVAAEKRMSTHIAELQALVEEREEELQYLKEHQDDGSREAELLERIDEDEAKISALETLLRDSQDMQILKDKLQRVELQLKDEINRVSAGDERHIELVREKEEALDELEGARVEICRLGVVVSQREAHINLMVERERNNTLRNTGTGLTSLAGVVTDNPCRCPSTPPPQTVPDEEAVVYIERLLAAIERLRGERDTLRRSVEFLESESKFAIDALEAKLSASLVSSPGDSSMVTINQLKAETDALHVRLAEVAEHEVHVVREKDYHIKRLRLAAVASAVTIEHFRAQADYYERSFLDVCVSRKEIQDILNKSQETIQDMEEKLEELGEKLEVTILCLEATTSQRNDIMSRLEVKDAEREEEVAHVKTAHQETRDNLARAEIQLGEMSNALHDVESERNSLTLQVENLLTDLRAAQDDVTNAESRYSALQFHQLSSMSSNAATRVLQGQIEELEMRVMRRTEQIGIHQHDIRRLETNLRLQEERLGEMTTELEMVAAQKDAMVEDCADAREARDEALARLEELEVSVESLEGRAENGDNAVAVMVGVVVQTVSKSRDALRRSNDNAREAKRELDRLDAEYHKMLRLLEEESTYFDAHLRISDDDMRQSALALAVSQVELKKALISNRNMREEKDKLECDARSQQDVLDIKSSEAASLREQLESHRHQASTTASLFATRTSELESQIRELQDLISSTTATHNTTVDELVRSKEHLQRTLDETQRSLVDSNIEDELIHLRARHVEELGEVQARLTETSNALEDLQTRHTLAEAECQRAVSDASRLEKELEQRLADTSENLQQAIRQQQQAEKLQLEKAKEISHLRMDRDAALSNAEQAQNSQDELRTVHERVLQELTQVQQKQKSDLTRITEESRVIQQRLESDLADLQSKFGEQSRELEQSIQEVGRLAHELRDEIKERSEDKEVYQKELDAVNQQYKRAESALTLLDQEMVVVRGQLERTKQELRSLEEEKLCLQEEITALEAELQRSISLGRFLESQVKESEEKVASFTKELERVQTELASSEKSVKAAEVNLGLQGIQHKRELADLQRELTVLRSRPDLQGAVTELEERNNEMEELLRSKCTEIEENDDRALEMLKDNKKLTTKVEALTRKVQNLQTKLAAAKAALPKTAVSEAPTFSSSSLSSSADPVSAPIYSASRPRSNTLSNIPPVPPVPSNISSPVIRTPSNRVASGQSSLPRPKTPERRAPPVFRARTPEKPFVTKPPSDITPSASTTGKKRRAPDDFEACEDVPPQGFTADSLPSYDVESSAPRVRRVLSSIQSGFTPVRYQGGRPTMPMPSPKRSATVSTRPSPLMADVTNSPRTVSHMSGQSAKTKRSWLGKIRGVSSQTGGRSGDSRMRYESS